jgi:anthranilate phosphoribosyltransferase
MATWHGYILLQRPPLFSAAEWHTALAALASALDASPDDPQPANRLHARLNLAGTAAILEAAFDEGAISPDAVAAAVSAALGVKYTVDQVKTAVSANLTLWRQGQPWSESHADAAAYLAANRAAWEKLP